jgi:DNA-binding transcriptional ArsR family regulator
MRVLHAAGTFCRTLFVIPLDKNCDSVYKSVMKQILTDRSIYEMQAEICKTLTNPKRIEILNTLKNEEKTVTQLVEALGASKANVSQHLAVMRHKGILSTRREGVNIYYRVSNPKVIDACALMKEVLFEQHAAKKKAVTGG